MEDLDAVNSPINQEAVISPNNQEADHSLINQVLVDPCLKHIFSYLPILERLKAEGVCKRWRTVSQKGWDDTDFLAIEEDDSDDIIRLVLQRCGHYLKKLSIDVSSKHPRCLTTIMELCKLDQLEDMEIIFNDESSTEDFLRDLREISEKAKNLVAVTIISRGIVYPIDCLNYFNPEILQRLHLDNYSRDFGYFDHERLSINPDRFPNLRELVLKYMEISDDEAKREEKESLKGLEKLNLHKCLIPQSFVERIKTFSNLRKLTLEQNDCDFTNNHIRIIAEHCDGIEELHIMYCSNVTSACFEYLGRMPSLETFHWETEDTMNLSNFMYLVNLRHLMLFIHPELHSDHELIELIVNSSKLEELTLWFDGDTAMDTTVIVNILQIFHQGQRKNHLDLTIKDFNFHHNELEISDHPLLTILHTDVD